MLPIIHLFIHLTGNQKKQNQLAPVIKMIKECTSTIVITIGLLDVKYSQVQVQHTNANSNWYFEVQSSTSQ